MGTYIEYNDLAARYRVFDTSSNANVSSDTIYYAEKEVEAALAPAYSVPFSAAHPTVKDLCIEMAYVRYMRTRKPKEGRLLDKDLRDRIKRIVSGDEPLITGSGTLEPTATGADLPGSTTEDYYPVHSMLGAENEYTQISSDRLQDLEDTRD